MHQRVRVQEFHCRGRIHGCLARGSARLTAGNHQSRAQPLSTTKHGVAHRFANSMKRVALGYIRQSKVPIEALVGVALRAG